ncbi:hypothetical protein X975_00836, partial [Stegodyphus mimosarum]
MENRSSDFRLILGAMNSYRTSDAMKTIGDIFRIFVVLHFQEVRQNILVTPTFGTLSSPVVVISSITSNINIVIQYT